jgi:hypothetical protein
MAQHSCAVLTLRRNRGPRDTNVRINQSAGLRQIWDYEQYLLTSIRATGYNEAAFRQEIILCGMLIPRHSGTAARP